MYDINKDMLVSVIIPVYNAEKYLKSKRKIIRRIVLP